MRRFRELLTCEPAARRLLAVHAQSSLGTGAGYVALLVLAYERFESPLAVSAMLLCELLPAMLLGPLAGAAADRFPRRRLLVAADALRAVAFVGLALVDPLWAFVALALLAGAGQALFQPAVMASIPDLVDDERVPATTAAYGALQEFGYVAGPVLAALAAAVVAPEGLLLANGLTFALSAAVLMTLPLHGGREQTPAGARRPSLVAAARDGARALRRCDGAWTLLGCSAVFVCLLGAVNVGELMLVRDALDGGAGAFSLVVATMGAGITLGSLAAGRAESPDAARRTYLAGLVLCAAGMAGCALAPSLAAVLPAFLVLGLGNGAALVSENVLLQRLVPEDVLGRAFGLKSALVAWSFAIAYFGGGLLVAALGPRAMFGAIAAGSLVVALTARTLVRRPAGYSLRARTAVP